MRLLPGRAYYHGGEMLGILLQIPLSPVTESTAIDFTWLFVKMIIALVAVCLFAVLVLRYLVPKIGLFKRYSANRYVEIIARQPLDHRKNLYIIKVGQKYALVGASDQSVNMIMELKKEDVEGNTQNS